LTWSSANAERVAIDPGIGNVDPGGSRQVCPEKTTEFTATAAGGGQTRTATANVTVNPPPPPPPPAKPKEVERLTLHINFDTDKADIRKEDVAEIEKAVAFVKKYPNNKVSIEGHTDNVGKDAYNQSLSERRAAAVKDYLIKNGAVDAARINAAGFGKTRPVADNKTKDGRFKNRRVEVVILSE
jgi:OOP family OmpA-OmpF porin